MSESAAWEMWAGTNLHGFCNIDADRTYPVLYGHAEPVQVLVLEREDGDYLGWVPAGESAALVKMRPGHPWAGNSGRIVPDPTAPDGAVKVLLDNGMSCYAWPEHYRRVTVIGRST